MRIVDSFIHHNVTSLAGAGLYNDGATGIATVEIELPKALTPEQREHFEALAKLEKAV